MSTERPPTARDEVQHRAATTTATASAPRGSSSIAVVLLGLCLVGCNHSILLQSQLGLSSPVAGHGDAAAETFVPALETHVGTTGLLDDEALATRGIGVGLSQRTRAWLGDELSHEVGVHGFWLSRRWRRFAATCRATIYLGLASRPKRVGAVVMAATVGPSALWYILDDQTFPAFVSVGTQLEADAAFGGGGWSLRPTAALGVGFAWRGSRTRGR